MSDDWDWLIKQYNMVANEPVSWWITADNLLVASRFLCLHSAHQLSGKEFFELHKKPPLPDETKVYGVIQMLRGMAVEALLKGLWVDYGGTLAENGRYKKIPDTTEHQLVSLVEKVSTVINLDLSSDERSVLEKLSISIIDGRYPIRKLWETRKPEKLPIWYVHRDEEIMASMISKLKSKIKLKYQL